MLALPCNITDIIFLPLRNFLLEILQDLLAKIALGTARSSPYDKRAIRSTIRRSNLLTRGLYNPFLISFSLLTHNITLTTMLLSEVPSLILLTCQAEIQTLTIPGMWNLNL